MTQPLLVRIATIGSVDDGKSTLLGRLLYDSKSIPLDQIESVRNASLGEDSHDINLALFTDGLRAEREANITIDVAYRYFSIQGRQFILADSPGHAQYTRNMVTATSLADAVLLIVDIQNGVSAQTQRHATIASLLGVPSIIVAVNKMDLVDFAQSEFDKLTREFSALISDLNFQSVAFVPVSALRGDNIVSNSAAMAWYQGQSILDLLLSLTPKPNTSLSRFQVQCVIRTGSDFRGYAGQLSAGSLRMGDPILVNPQGATTHISGLSVMGESVEQIEAGQPAIIEVEHDLDIARGDTLSPVDCHPSKTQRFRANLCWMGDASSQRKTYTLRQGPQEVACVISQIEHKLDIESNTLASSHGLQTNDLASVILRTSRPIAVDRYRECRPPAALSSSIQIPIKR